MDTITLAIVQKAGRGTSRRKRLITGRTVRGNRPLYVVENPADTLIVSSDQETIMATGVDLMAAAEELAEIHGVPVRLVDERGRQMWCVGVGITRVAA